MVVIDIFRATSCMVAGLNSGVEAIYPVATVEECLSLGESGMTMAGERNGKKLAEFDIGNSPYDYMEECRQGTTIATTTTNGTKAISLSKKAEEVLVSSFLNLDSTVAYLQECGKDVVLHCAGWKGMINLEDTLYAGAIIQAMDQKDELADDAGLMASALYSAHQHNLLGIASQSSHAQRLESFGIQKDIEFCLKKNVFDGVIYLDGDRLLKK